MLPVALLLTAILSAQPDTLDSARISGERGGRELTASGVPAMQIGREAIDRSGARELHEILRTLPGLTVQDYGGLGGLKTVSVRGLGAAHTAVCTDGIMITDAQQGSIDLAQFDLDNTGAIVVEIGSPDEIFKPAAAFSSGGVLSLSPKTPEFGGGSKTLASASLTWGSFGTVKPFVRVDRMLAPGWSLTATGSYLRSDGDYPFVFGKVLTIDPDTGDATTETKRQLRLGSDVSTIKSELRLEGNTSRGGTIRAAAQWLDSERGLPGPAILYTQNPTERLHDRDLSARVVYDNAFGTVRHDIPRPDRESPAWRLRLSAAYRHNRTRYTDTSAVYTTPADDRYLQQIISAGAILQRSVLTGKHDLRFVLAQDVNYARLDANTPACPQPSRISGITALSGQYKTGRFKATAALTATLEHESIASPTAFHSEPAPDRRRLSPSLSLSWAAVPGLHVRAFAKDGFRVPTFNDLYYDRVGSIHLVPEKALQTGAGLTWQGTIGPAFVTLTADGYHNRVKDKIIAVPTMFVWRMRNLGKVLMDGADLSASLNLPLGRKYTLRSDASWSFLSAIDVSDPEAKNYRHQIQYTPRHSGALSASLSREGASLSYTLCAVGKRWFLPQNSEANALPAYFDHALALRKDFNLRRAVLSLSAEALNLAGVNYEIVRSYPMPGRQLRITAKIKV